jgi:Family of unknown function (DUF6519)
MKADISADTFREAHHFSAVVVGQGQVLVDSALNEQTQIDRHRTEGATHDLVGASGVPKLVGGFAVSVAPDGLDLLVEPGRIYVDGITCENDPPAVAGTVVSTGAGSSVVEVVSAAADGVPFATGQWVDVPTTGTRARITAVSARQLTLGTALPALAAGAPVLVTRVTSLRHQPDRLAFDPFAAGAADALQAGAYRVELDVWDRHLTPVEWPAMREVALGDAESATRVRTVWQVRVVAAGAVGGGSCTIAAPAPRGRLAASTAPGLPSDGPCVLPDEAGYRGLENQLYRIEVHSASATEVVLKWQRDNASTVSAVVSLGSTLQLDDLGRDDERAFGTAPYVEVTDDQLELEQQVSDLIGVVGTPDASGHTLTLASAPVKARLERNARARRWDGVITIDLTSPGASAPVGLERGVQVSLTPGELRPGDYWMVPGRTSNSAGGGTLVWPQDDTGAPLSLEPQGIDHHRTSLAIVDASSTGFLAGPTALRECRTLFPPLTAIAAADVSIDPTPCGFGVGVTTVQDAIDALCGGDGDGCCTHVAVPGPGWESVFDKVANGADASICFPVGSYPMPATKTVSGKGHLVLRGHGRGSLVAGSSQAPALSFTGCAGVTLESLRFTGADGTRGGLLTIDRCGTVIVTDCWFTGGAASVKQGSCLKVTGGTLRVSDSSFAVGNLQTALTAVDTAQTVVQGCQFGVVPLPASALSVPITHATKYERLQARRLLISGLGPAPATGNRVAVKIGSQTLSFGTPPAVKAAWANAIPGSFTTMKQFQKAADKVLRAVFAGTSTAATAAIEAFIADRIIARRTATMSQAIVVAGRTVGDVRIEDNRIAGAIQGIHVGTSHAGQPRSGPADLAGRVDIRDNKVQVVVPPDGARARHAIFVGNADRLLVNANDVRFTNLSEGGQPPSDGIRIYGFIGRAMTLRDNVVEDFPGGIRLMMLMARGAGQAQLTRMWAVEDNLITGADTPVTVDGPLRQKVKFRGNQPGPQ